MSIRSAYAEADENVVFQKCRCYGAGILLQHGFVAWTTLPPLRLQSAFTGLLKANLSNIRNQAISRQRTESPPARFSPDFTSFADFAQNAPDPCGPRASDAICCEAKPAWNGASPPAPARCRRSGLRRLPNRSSYAPGRRKRPPLPARPRSSGDGWRKPGAGSRCARLPHGWRSG